MWDGKIQKRINLEKTFFFVFTLIDNFVIPILILKILCKQIQQSRKKQINFQVDYYTTESVVSVDWENGFVEASAKENENVNQVILNAN